MTRPTWTPRLVPGTLVVAYLLAGGRWGSYLGWPEQNLYLTDGFLLVGAVMLAVRLRVRPSRRDLVALLPVLAYVTWAALRLVGNLRLDSSVVRDGAPYGYAAVALLGLIRVDAKAWRRSLLVLQGALVVHLAWVTLSFYSPTLATDSPLLGGRVHVLETRADYDGSVLAMLAALTAHQCIRASRWWIRVGLLPLIFLSAYLDLQLGSRGGLLALMAALLVVVIANRQLARRLPLPVVAATLAAVVAVAVVLVPHTSLYRRISGDAAFRGNAANGTASARWTAWGQIFTYLDGSPLAVVGGVGFGPDFLYDSGAVVNFEGTTYQDVRAPHDYLINTYARLGLLGVGLFLWLLVGLLLAGSRRFLTPFRYTEADLLCACILVTLFSTSLVGVILESPFGAIPFFWAAGRLLVSDSPREALTGRLRARHRAPRVPAS